MDYLVILGKENGVYRARIPNFPDLTAEGTARDEAVRNVERAVQNYLAGFEVTMIRGMRLSAKRGDIPPRKTC